MQYWKEKKLKDKSLVILDINTDISGYVEYINSFFSVIKNLKNIPGRNFGNKFDILLSVDKQPTVSLNIAYTFRIVQCDRMLMKVPYEKNKTVLTGACQILLKYIV